MFVLVDNFEDILKLKSIGAIVVLEQVHYSESIEEGKYASYVANQNVYAIKDGFVYAHKIQRDTIETLKPEEVSKTLKKIESAKASLATAQLTYDSKEELYKENVISSFDLSTAKNSLLAAKAQLAQAKAQEVSARNNLSYTVVKSPADGVVGTLPYRVGALVSSALAQPLTTVSDNSDMYVYFSMTENQLLGLIRQYGSKEEALKNMPAIDLQLNDKSAYSERGQIESISGVIDRSTGTVSLRAVFPNKEGLLHSGGAGNVIVPVQKTAALTIPQAATFEIQDKRYVYKVVDGKAQSSQVQVTRVNGGREFIVDEGLAPGDVIVAEGVGLLREGTPVKAKAAQTPVAGVTNANQSSSTETTTKSPATTTEN